MIICSAVWHKGRLFAGLRHNHCIHEAVTVIGIRPATGPQGFMTDKGEYLNRRQAAEHAIACGQIYIGWKDHRGREWVPHRLHSEDIWRDNSYDYPAHEVIPTPPFPLTDEE